MLKKITPFLWFDSNAEEAVNFYVSVFPNSKILSESRYGEDGPGPAGQVMVVKFQLEGQEFMALNGGPVYNFSPGISFMISCDTQEEVDHYWNKLVEGGEPNQCGWLTDKFGLTWQVTPAVLGELMQDPDPERAKSVMNAMLQMKKLDIAALKRARDEPMASHR